MNLGILGTGGFGEVKRVYDSEKRKFYALKCSIEEDSQSLIHEIEILHFISKFPEVMDETIQLAKIEYKEIKGRAN